MSNQSNNKSEKRFFPNFYKARAELKRISGAVNNKGTVGHMGYATIFLKSNKYHHQEGRFYLIAYSTFYESGYLDYIVQGKKADKEQNVNQK